ncbi:MAG: hypothetical protein QM790_08450 [Nibricoccus sp.]
MAVALTAFAALCIFVLTNPRPPVYDEGAHLARASALASATSIRGWLLENDTSAAGPLYPALHYSLSLGKGVLPAPWFRLPNLAALILVVLLLGDQLKRRGVSNHWAIAFTLLATPTIWVLSGLALTEMPALCGAAVACYGASRLAAKEGVDWTWATVVALGVVLATTGRQTYAAALPGIVMLAAADRRSFLVAAGAVFVGMVPLFALIVVWGGLLPPKLTYMGGGFSLLHIVYALGYVGITVLLLAPGFLLARWKIVLPVAATITVLNSWFGWVSFTTLSSVQRMAGHPGLMRSLEAAASVVFIGAAAAFLLAMVLELLRSRERVFWGFALSTIGLCLACGAVTAQFSSRYTGMTAIFLVPLLVPWVRFSGWTVLRLVFGLSIGAAALYSYLRPV